MKNKKVDQKIIDEQVSKSKPGYHLSSQELDRLAEYVLLLIESA